ncbi:MAG: PQQ-like beta-propeller repeat protein [Planctomycetia bacterium]|nr:PQQ-like beta-propeller repeat protein [Planctomycetia bacterium]
MARANVGISLLLLSWSLVAQAGCDTTQADPGRVREAAAASAPPATIDWPGFRGPNRNGISTETEWLKQWPAEGPKRLWSAQVGLGYSSVAVADGKAYTLGNRDGNETVYCFDAATGRELWKYSYPCDLVANLHLGGPGATPTIDGDRVYTVSKQGQLHCFATGTGKLLWTVLLTEALSAVQPEWGFTSSPLVYGELLVLDAGGLVAFDKLTGKQAWRSMHYRAGYGSPVVYTAPTGETLIAAITNDAFVVVEPRNGREVAKYPWESQYTTASTTPVISGRTFFLSTGYGGGCALVELVGEKFRELYRNEEMSNHMCTSVLRDGRLYGIHGNSHTARQCKLVCLDLATGKRLWEQRGFGCGALTMADDKLLIQSDEGFLSVAEASPSGYVELARTRVFDGPTWTMPVLCRGRIYCRSEAGEVVCIDVRK